MDMTTNRIIVTSDFNSVVRDLLRDYFKFTAWYLNILLFVNVPAFVFVGLAFLLYSIQLWS